MIHYHGIGGMDTKTISFLMPGRHAFCSFASPINLHYVADICSTFALDNGAYTAWRQKKAFDFAGYREWVEGWRRHPGYDFHLIPDVIDGDEQANRKLIEDWPLPGVPVWHMHESIDFLQDLAKGFKKVAIGASGQYAIIGGTRWWQRMGVAMEAICEGDQPVCKLHGLRMLKIDVFGKIPLHSGDSTVAVRDAKYDASWKGYNSPKSKHVRSLVIADRIESFQSAPSWKRIPQQQLMFEQ